MYAYRQALFRLVSGVVCRSHDDGDLSHTGRKLLCRYGKSDFCFQACCKIFLQSGFRIISNLVNHGSKTGRNGIVPVILYGHGNRRHFFIFFLQRFTAVYGKADLRRVILHDESVCRVCNALCVRDISRRIGTSDVGDSALPVCGKGDFRLTILKLCSRFFRCAERRRYSIGNLLCPTAFLRHRNTQNQTFSADNPVKDVRCFLLEGNFADHRLCLVKFCSQCVCHRFIARCIHRLEGVGVLSLFQSVESQLIGFTAVLRGAACHGKLRVGAVILLNIKRCHALIV